LLVAYHPVTLAPDTLAEADALFAALEALPDDMLFCYPNADAGSRALIERTKAFLASRGRGAIFTNLDAVTIGVCSLRSKCSSGIPAAELWKRILSASHGQCWHAQQGRERARNVLDAAADKSSILKTIDIARTAEFRQSLAAWRTLW